MKIISTVSLLAVIFCAGGLLADTAPTIAWLLGLEIPEVWRGRPVLK